MSALEELFLPGLSWVPQQSGDNMSGYESIHAIVTRRLAGT
jgi:hypothetical protein